MSSPFTAFIHHEAAVVSTSLYRFTIGTDLAKVIETMAALRQSLTDTSLQFTARTR